jgi:signal transduction histidine kinase
MTGNRRKLLIVDPDAELRQTVAGVLAGYDYAVTLAAAELEALERIKADPPELVLLELQLAESNGLDLLRMIRSRHPGIGCIAMSPPADADSVIAAQREGALDYLVKPVPLDALLAALSRGFDRLYQKRQVKLAFDELMKAKEILRKGERQRNDMLSRIGRELRQPLNTMLGHAEILRSQLYGPLGDSRYVDYAERLIGDTRRLIEFVGRLADQAAAENGSLALAEDTFDIVALVGECIAETRADRYAEGLSFEGRLPGQPHFVVADRWRLKQAIGHVVANAAKFNKPGGHVTVSLTFNHARDIEVRVEDDGPGIAPEEQEKLFMPFSPLGRGQGGDKGAGLGLCLAANFLKLHGGAVKLKSTLAAGTVVTLTLPGARLVSDPPSGSGDPSSGASRAHSRAHSHSVSRSHSHSVATGQRNGGAPPAAAPRVGSGGAIGLMQRRLADMLAEAPADPPTGAQDSGAAANGPSGSPAGSTAALSTTADQSELFRFTPLKSTSA